MFAQIPDICRNERLVPEYNADKRHIRRERASVQQAMQPFRRIPAVFKSLRDIREYSVRRKLSVGLMFWREVHKIVDIFLLAVYPEKLQSFFVAVKQVYVFIKERAGQRHRVQQRLCVFVRLAEVGGVLSETNP
jgi:hypothetical protein